MNSENPPTAPPPLVTAASITAVEGVLLVAPAVLEIANLTGGRVTMGLTTAVFFAAFGVLPGRLRLADHSRSHVASRPDPAGPADRPGAGVEPARWRDDAGVGGDRRGRADRARRHAAPREHRGDERGRRALVLLERLPQLLEGLGQQA
ncbi:hypothetical protein [Nocardioides sp. B-3]|uniref:hypothetical protein n=1 Tax=Nocardioides sp. B-3 TaxID=2895565 RepID=UPI0021534147|nr:hypothetical protein [Nocardioides sp. B-3]UUZ58319.1 hypothetical protein LP418_19170 [Nocardioides sp. B-3]